MGSWMRATVRTEDNQAISFEVTRVTVVRDWFLIDELVEKRLALSTSSNEADMIISDGAVPSLTDYPNGVLSVFPLELVLIRNISYNSSVAKTDHPLALFAHPERIQILGYIVRALPKA